MKRSLLPGSRLNTNFCQSAMDSIRKPVIQVRKNQTPQRLAL
jgi:hypothetical protein